MWVNLKLKHYHRYNFNKVSKRNLILNNGHYGLKVLYSGFITTKEIKTIMFFLKKSLKKEGKIWLNINPNFIKTKKPIETRMGKGKGNFDSYMCVVQKGKIILEIQSKSNRLSELLLTKIKKKLSLKTKIIKQFF